MPKSENPPNTPEIKGKKDGYKSENLDQLRTRIFNCFKKVDQKCVQNLGESTR